MKVVRRVRQGLMSLPVGARAAIGLVVIIVVLQLVAISLNSMTNAPGSSSDRALRSVDANGLAAYVDLLARYGDRVDVVPTQLARTELAPQSTLMLIGPKSISDADRDAALTFVVAGGRLVVLDGAQPVLGKLRDVPPLAIGRGQRRWSVTDPSLAPIREVEADGHGAYAVAGDTTVLVGSTSRSLLASTRLGRGEMVFLADASPITNGFIARADNASFAVALAGDRGATVQFAEAALPTGVAAIPRRWQIALALGTLAALVLIWARGARFGPPERDRRALAPARAEYVAALARTLARTDDRYLAVADLQGAARAGLAQRAGLDTGATEAELAPVGAAFGLTPAQVSALVTPVRDDETLLALGRTVAALHSRTVEPSATVRSSSEEEPVP